MPTDIQPYEQTDALALQEEPLDAATIEAITRGEVDIQVSTARRYPRSPERFVKKAMSLATIDEETAEACYYSLKRWDSKSRKYNIFQGPGIRMAEIVASAWGNLRCEARVVEENDRFIVARGSAWDMESNVLMTQEVRRRITYQDGNKYSDDMVGVTANAACSIALRNAIFKVIPRSLVDKILSEAKKVAVGDATTLTSKREKTLAWLVGKGATEDNILRALGRNAVGDIDLSDLETLIGLGTAIRDGQITVEEAFPKVPMVDTVTSVVTAAADAVAGKTNSNATATKPALQPAERSSSSKSDEKKPEPNPGDMFPDARATTLPPSTE